MMNEDSKTLAVSIGQQLGDAALNGQLTAAVVVTIGQNGLNISWCGTDNFGALGLLATGQTLTMAKTLSDR